MLLLNSLSYKQNTSQGSQGATSILWWFLGGFEGFLHGSWQKSASECLTCLQATLTGCGHGLVSTLNSMPGKNGSGLRISAQERHQHHPWVCGTFTCTSTSLLQTQARAQHPSRVEAKYSMQQNSLYLLFQLPRRSLHTLGTLCVRISHP